MSEWDEGGEWEPAPPRACAVCADPMTDERQWVLLNRFGVGTGSGRALCAPPNCDGDVLWEVDPDAPSDEEHASGAMTCWPQCTQLYIEAKMAEANVEIRKMDQ